MIGTSFSRHAQLATLAVSGWIATFGMLAYAIESPGTDETPERGAQREVEFHKGMSYVSWWYDLYESADSDSSLTLLAQTNTDWVGLLVTWYQDTEHSTTIYRDPLKTPTDAGLLRVIQRCHDLGIQVMLKPHVDCKNGVWRGMIEFSTEDDWALWFDSYTQFITYYAALAESAGVEEFSAGCELCGTVYRVFDWEAVISEIRSHFSGMLTYAANWDRYRNVLFWHSLDCIGIDAYFDLTDKPDPTLAELLAAWVPWENQISAYSDAQGMPVLFTEIGYRSVDGANIHPWLWGTSGDIDLQEQVDCYQAAFETFWDKPYFRGYLWWAWETDPDHGGLDDDGYSPHGKPAEDLLTCWYGGGGTTLPESHIRTSGEVRAELVIPNPYPPGSEILLRLPCTAGTGRYRFAVFDVLGRRVSELQIRRATDLEISTAWDGYMHWGVLAAPGVYYCRARDTGGADCISRPIVIVR